MVRGIGIGIHYEHDYRVSIPVDISCMTDSDCLIDTYTKIREWVEELTEWQGTFSIRVGFGNIDIWFKYPEHATICALKWL